MGYSVRGCKESDMAERAHIHTHVHAHTYTHTVDWAFHFIGEKMEIHRGSVTLRDGEAH